MEKSLANKPRLILLHRSDLISKQDQRALLDYYKRTDDHVLLTSTKTKMNMKVVLFYFDCVLQKQDITKWTRNFLTEIKKQSYEGCKTYFEQFKFFLDFIYVICYHVIQSLLKLGKDCIYIA